MAHPAFLTRRAKIKLRFFGAGFTLVELIVVIGIIAGGIVAVQTAIQYGLRSAEIAVDSIVAAHLAEEGVELIRNIRDTNWAEREQNPGTRNTWDYLSVGDYLVHYPLTNNATDIPPIVATAGECLAQTVLYFDSTNGTYGYNSWLGFNGTIPTKYHRLINIGNCAGGICRDVTSTVCWSDRNGNHEIAISERLYAWRPSPSP